MARAGTVPPPPLEPLGPYFTFEIGEQNASRTRQQCPRPCQSNPEFPCVKVSFRSAPPVAASAGPSVFSHRTSATPDCTSRFTPTHCRDDRTTRSANPTPRSSPSAAPRPDPSALVTRPAQVSARPFRPAGETGWACEVTREVLSAQSVTIPTLTHSGSDDGWKRGTRCLSRGSEWVQAQD